jgi:arabinose-5-phosphate isomerase
MLKFNFAAMIGTILENALKTIELEAESVRGLAGFINDSFEQVVNAIHQSKGRVVISGVGKSAIVGQKIVATLNSTGTPALFMHAADAIHGDLGMIQPHDVVMLISKSGESPEVKVLVPLIRNFGNTLIGMVGKMDSFLATQADLVVNTTVSQEACPNNLAPTTSTTAQMVMGDTIAVCLMQLNRFTGHDFAKYHPGGNLGKRMYLRVADLYVHNEKPEVTPATPLKEVIMVISKSRLGATAVLNESRKVLGIITDGDVRRMLQHVDDISTVKAEGMLSANPKTILPDTLAVEALEMLRQFDISQLIVTDEKEEYVGIIHLHDLVREGII